MVGYYISTGDEETGDKFIPYVWGGNGLGKRIKENISIKNYGNDLKLLLIKYYVEGRFSSYLPIEPKLGNYSSKSKDIGIDVAVTTEIFHNCNEFERREFIVDSTLNAVKLVQARLKKKKLDIDFDSLLSDLTKISKQYLEQEGKYSEV